MSTALGLGAEPEAADLRLPGQARVNQVRTLPTARPCFRLHTESSQPPYAALILTRI